MEEINSGLLEKDQELKGLKGFALDPHLALDPPLSLPVVEVENLQLSLMLLSVAIEI